MLTILFFSAILGTLAHDKSSQQSQVCEVESQTVTGESLLQTATQRIPNIVTHLGKPTPMRNLILYKQSLSGRRSIMDHKRRLAWTTNIGQDGHSCSGSKFDVDVSGDYSGLVLKEGILLKKGSCQQSKTKAKPLYTQELTCDDDATGCHMWCAPVWISHKDASNWGEFDERCRSWNGSYVTSDAICKKADHLFTWARTEVPSGKNMLDLKFAITKSCDRWCSPLWVTLYDEADFAKSWRWCFNRKDDWGGCDIQQDVGEKEWHEHSFKITQFVQKHGYAPDLMILELSVYAEFNDSPEVIMSLVQFSEESQEAATPKPTEMKGDIDKHAAKMQSRNCGQAPCGKDQKCCRKGNSTLATKCCPTDWQCCEDSCCPAYYTCTADNGKHSCDAPKDEPKKKPDLCML